MPLPHSHWSEAHHICQQLTRAGLSAFPVRTKPIISIGCPSLRPSNEPHHLIVPLQRLQIVSVLESAGYGRRTDDSFRNSTSDKAAFRFPGPSESLRSDPSEPIRNELHHENVIVWATSTQTLLALLHASGGQHELSLQQELLHLVWEQPVDLIWIRQCAESSGLKKVQSLLLPLARSQAEGIELRRKGEFQSLLSS